MKLDLLLRGVLLIDTTSGKNDCCDVGIAQGQIVSITETGQAPEARKIIFVPEGTYLLPGLIDFHTHLFQHGSDFGMDADQMLMTGVTCAVDMGTAGTAGFPAMFCCDLSGKKLLLRAFINLSPVGQPGRGIYEPLEDAVIHEEKIQESLQRYPDVIAGIKVRLSSSIVKELGLRPLKRAIEIGERLGLPVCVHTTDPPCSAAEIAALLRPGDIYSHVYHGKGNTILDVNGRVQDELKTAQKRGVIMEVGNGRMNFNFPVAESAMAEGFFPDIISSDATATTFHREQAMWDLPMVMSKFLQLGMPLHKVVKAVTETPAACLGLSHRIGRIREGYEANLTLCHIKKEPVTFCDSEGNARQGEHKLIVDGTIRCGQLVWLGNESLKSQMGYDQS